jgi:hypothetical protein
MNAYGEVDVEIHVCLVSAVVGGELLAPHPGRFISGKNPPVPIG